MEKLNLVRPKFEELPNNIEAEQAILGSIMVSNEIFDDVSPIIGSQNFFDYIKKFMLQLKSLFLAVAGKPITLKNLFENEKDDLNIPII